MITKNFVVYYKQAPQHCKDVKPHEKQFQTEAKAIEYANYFNGKGEYATVWDTRTRTKIHQVNDPDSWKRDFCKKPGSLS